MHAWLLCAFPLNRSTADLPRACAALFLSAAMRHALDPAVRAGNEAFLLQAGVLTTLARQVRGCLHEGDTAPRSASSSTPDPACMPRRADRPRPVMHKRERHAVDLPLAQRRLLRGVGAARLLLALSASSAAAHAPHDQSHTDSVDLTATDAATGWVRAAKATMAELKGLVPRSGAGAGVGAGHGSGSGSGSGSGPRSAADTHAGAGSGGSASWHGLPASVGSAPDVLRRLGSASTMSAGARVAIDAGIGRDAADADADETLMQLRQLTVHDMFKAAAKLAMRDHRVATAFQFQNSDAFVLRYLQLPVAQRYHARVCLKLLQELWVSGDVNVGAVFGCTVLGTVTDSPSGAQPPGLAPILDTCSNVSPGLLTAALPTLILPTDCADAAVEAAAEDVPSMLSTLSAACAIVPPSVPSIATGLTSVGSFDPGTGGDKASTLRRAALATLREGTRCCPRACVGVREADGIQALSAMLDSGDRVVAETAAAILMTCSQKYVGLRLSFARCTVHRSRLTCSACYCCRLCSDPRSRREMRRIGGVAAAVRRLGYTIADTALGLWGVLGPHHEPATESRVSSTRLAELCAGILLNTSSDCEWCNRRVTS